MNTYNINIDGKRYEVSVDSIGAHSADVTVNGRHLSVGIDRPAENPDPSGPVAVEAPAAPVIHASGSKAVTSPLPGVVIEISVREGAHVRRGDRVAVIEAMKMENEVLAPKDGTIISLKAEKGDSVQEGDIIAIVG